jgi:hypothetical protein
LLQSEIESQPEVDATLVAVACKTAASAAQKEQQRQKGAWLDLWEKRTDV